MENTAQESQLPIADCPALRESGGDPLATLVVNGRGEVVQANDLSLFEGAPMKETPAIITDARAAIEAAIPEK